MNSERLLLIRFIVCVICISFVSLSGNEPEIIVSDFQVNEFKETEFSRRSPVIAVAGNGDFVAAWQDMRSGQANIYAQRFRSDGTPLGDNFLVNDGNNSGSGQPAIAVDTNGDFVIVWPDYFKRYNIDGQPQVYKKVYYGNSQNSPAVAYADSGHIIVVVNQTKNNIVMRKLDRQGNYLSEVVQVNEEVTNAMIQDAAIACNSSGSYVIAWQDIDYAINRPNISYRRFDTNDTPIADQQKVDDASPGEKFVQREAAIALNDSGEFIISWTDGRLGNLDIFAQRFDAEGQTLGTNFRVNDDPGSLDQRYSTLAIKSDGGCLITWANTLLSGDVYGQFISESGEPVSGNFIINDDTTGTQTTPDVGIDGNDDFYIIWPDNRSSVTNTDVYIQKILSGGTLDGSNFKISDNTFNGNQWSSNIISFDDGRRMVIWQDNSVVWGDIYAQVYNDVSNPVGENFKVNGDNFAGSMDVAAGSDNKALVVFTNHEKLNNEYHYYLKGQMISSDGTVSGSIINIDTLDSGSGFVSVDYNNSNYIVTWHESQPPDYGNIFARRLDNNGLSLGSGFKVNDDMGTTTQDKPDIAINDHGEFLIVWQDTRYNNWPKIYAQLFNSDGERVNSNFRIEHSQADSLFLYYLPCAAATDSGKFVVVYRTYQQNVENNVSLRFLGSDGNYIGNSIRLNDEPIHDLYGSQSAVNPAIATGDSSRIVVTWDNEYEGDDYYYYYTLRGQRLISNSKVDANFSIADDVGSEQNNPAVDLRGREIFVSWEDNRNEKISADIWTKVLDFGKSGPTSVSKLSQQPEIFNLSQNYPNPFNPMTTINYKLPITDYINLSIYNLLGQKIITLVSEKQTAGSYKVKWDGGGFASGVYIYRLEAGGKMLHKKMLLLK